ncbi:HD domain-containing protein [Pyrococcus abyssi]|nr:HD family hydrolase [Pyrococcus abyssi]CCE71080.1 TPA: Metal-dependent phosphohydrolase, HD superfamily [Pyrococcus abyssi GE5]
MIEKILLAQTLKRLPRMGWLISGIPNPESVADHSFGVAFISLLLLNKIKEEGVKIDENRVLKMAIIHDIGEALITDIPLRAQKYLDKDAAEDKAVKEIFPEFYELYREYQEGKSLEAQLVKFADKIDMVLQAWQYELSGNKNLEDFWRALEELEKLEIARYFKELLEEVRRLKGDI